MSLKISQLPSGAAVGGTEQFVADQTGSTVTITASQLAAFVLSTLEAETLVTPAGASDQFLVVRSGVIDRLAIGDVVSYAMAGLWTVSAGGTVLTGDTLLASRSSTPCTVTVDALATFVLTNVQGSVLDLSGLATATLGTGDYYLVGQGSSAKKTTLSALETKLWSDLKSYVAALTAETAAADTDVLYAIQGGVAKSVTPAVLASYVATKQGSAILAGLWSAPVVTSAATGDMLALRRGATTDQISLDNLMAYETAALAAAAAVSPALDTDAVLVFRSGTPKTVTAANLASYAIAGVWTATTQTTPLGTDTIPLGRAGVGNQVSVANLQTYLLSGIQGTALAVSGLSDAGTLAAADYYLVWQSGSPTRATLSTLEAKVYGDFAPYVVGLADMVTLIDTDMFHCVHAMAGRSATALELATYTLGKLAAVSTVTPWATGDKILLNRSGTGLAQATVDDLITYAGTGLQTSVLNVTGLAAGTITATLEFACCTSGGVPKQVAFGPTVAGAYGDGTLMSAIVAGLATYVTSFTPLSATAGTDLFYTLQGGTTPAAVAASTLAVYCWAQSVASIQALTAKTTPIDGDLVTIQDSAASDSLKNVTLSNLWTNYLVGKLQAASGLALTLPVLSANNTALAAAASPDWATVGLYDLQVLSSANASYGWQLRAGVAGQVLTLINTSATAGTLYPATGETLSGLAANTPVTIAAGHTVQCRCTAAGVWWVVDLGAALAA